MLLDDRPAYPMDSFRILRFSGHLDFDVLEASIVAVVRLNPMLRSIAVKSGLRHFSWQEVDRPVFIKRCQGSTRPAPERIDLFREPGFKVYFAEDENSVTVLFQFHHSVSDGLGEMDFIGDVLTDYVVRCTGETPPVNPRNLDATLLPLRGKSGLTWAKYFHFYWSTVVTTQQLLFKFPVPLAPCKKNDTSVPNPNYFTFCETELTQDETQRYFAAAKSQNVTINDYLLRDLYLTIGDWRQRWLSKRRKGLLRIAVPMNLRTEQIKRIPASNTVTMIFLDRRDKDFSDADKLLQGIQREMDWVKRRGQKHVMLLTLHIRDCLPGGIAMALRKNICRSTAVLSNLGRVLESLPIPRRSDDRLIVGDAVLETVDASPPIRPGTLISFSALTYAKRLRLILRYDAENMTAEQADDFLQRFAERLK
jgi:NRPS condensation-like uncharacterized protein